MICNSHHLILQFVDTVLVLFFKIFYLLQVLIVSDEAEVRKIVRAAHWVMDRLGLVQAVTSLKGLVVSFKVKCLKFCLFVLQLFSMAGQFNLLSVLQKLTELSFLKKSEDQNVFSCV